MLRKVSILNRDTLRPIFKLEKTESRIKEFVIDKRVLVTGLLFLVAYAPSLGTQPVARHILALYDSERGQSTRINHIHANAEVVLNHLGCFVDYWDLQDGLPDEKIMEKYRGVLTWFYSNSMRHPEQYLKWAARQVAAGRKFVIIGDVGATVDSRTGKLTDTDATRQFYERLGFQIDNSMNTDDPSRIELVFRDPQMVEFERSLDYEVSYYRRITPLWPEKTNVYLRLQRADERNSKSTLVFTTPTGGFVATSYAIYENAYSHQRRWRLNPFLFFNEAFDLGGLPRPDVTTLNGMRIWCSHIDGDGLISKSETKPNTFCGEIIRDQIIKKYQWPISVSVVVGEVIQGPEFVDISRSIFELDWVEAASHSYAHPFYWSEDYRNKEKYETRHLQIPGYTFDLQKEVIGSVEYINETLLPPGKKVKTFFWTGNCEPQAEALALCEEIGIYNTNGGDTIFDSNQPTYTGVAPLGVPVGDYWQVYSPNTNENVYTDDWGGPFYGFKFVLDTFKNTESPVRIKPINIYYHFYSGEKWAALNALKQVIETTVTQNVAPMFITEYIEMVHGFRSAEFDAIGPNRWRLSQYGKCTTVRFDNTDLFPNLAQSSGVLGFNHYQGSLYVHLEERDEAIIALSDSRPEMVYLEQGSHRTMDWTVSKELVTFLTDGFGKATFILSNLSRDSKYSVLIDPMPSNSSMKKVQTVGRTDSDGRFQIMHNLSGPVEVEINRIQSGI
ncbi:DUF2194 domain-containing protein [bacterium]|nr:DUF2194 domain-containing protein [bacterium]